MLPPSPAQSVRTNVSAIIWTVGYDVLTTR